MQTMDTFFYGNPFITCILAIVYFMILSIYMIQNITCDTIIQQTIHTHSAKNQFKKTFVANLCETVKVSNA